MVKNPSAGRSAIRCASGWTSHKRGDRREVLDLLIGRSWESAAGIRVGQAGVRCPIRCIKHA